MVGMDTEKNQITMEIFDVCDKIEGLDICDQAEKVGLCLMTEGEKYKFKFSM